MVDEGGDDFVERRLDLGDRFHGREAGTEDVGAADGTGGVLAALVIALMEVTEFLAAKSGRAAEDAIFFEMVAGTKGHRASEKRAKRVAFRNSLFALCSAKRPNGN